jgi:hypothetical protein
MTKGILRSQTYAGTDNFDGEEFREGYVSANDGCRLHYQVTGADGTRDKVRGLGCRARVAGVVA